LCEALLIDVLVLFNLILLIILTLFRYRFRRGRRGLGLLDLTFRDRLRRFGLLFRDFDLRCGRGLDLLGLFFCHFDRGLFAAHIVPVELVPARSSRGIAS
jgi:hypothetical protein